jgi:hypothetical protein
MTAVKIKKVNPYPIKAALAGAAGTIAGKIVKLTQVGFLVETEKALSPGQQFTIQFELPVMVTPIAAVGVVVKVYSRYGGVPGQSKSHALNEIHFKSLSDDQSQRIYHFLSTIKQI